MVISFINKKGGVQMKAFLFERRRRIPHSEKKNTYLQGVYRVIAESRETAETELKRQRDVWTFVKELPDPEIGTFITNEIAAIREE